MALDDNEVLSLGNRLETIGKAIVKCLMNIHSALTKPQGQTEAGTILVTKSWTYRSKDEMDATVSEKMEVRTFATTPARAKASWGETIPRAERFAFYRIDVGVEIPCYTEELAETMDLALKMAKDRVALETGLDNSPDDGVPRI
jgi:hypothetical protein